MEKETKNVTYLGRGIHDKKFAESLMNGKLRQMLIVINNDKDLDVQIRKDYLNIYYQGGNIARVKSENSVEFDKFYFYLDRKTIPKKDLSQVEIKKLKSHRVSLVSKFEAGNYEAYFVQAKEVMDKWFKVNPKLERLEQHKLSIENQYNKSDYTIIDLEYEVSILCDFICTHIPDKKVKAKKPRFDIIAINKQGKLCIIELKKGLGALGNTSGLQEHWDCYQKSIGRNHKSFMNEMTFLLKQKQDFNLIDKQVVINSPDPEFMFAYSYDNKTSQKNQDITFQMECSKVNPTIPILTLAFGTSKLMDK
jgi:hypothetical protein